MSIEICDKCERQVDTDKEEIHYLDEQNLCEHCMTIEGMDTCILYRGFRIKELENLLTKWLSYRFVCNSCEADKSTCSANGCCEDYHKLIETTTTVLNRFKDKKES